MWRAPRMARQLSVAALRALPLRSARNALRCWIGAVAGWPLPDARRLEEIAGAAARGARGCAIPRVRWGGVQVQRHAARA